MLSFNQFVKLYGNNINQYIFEHLDDQEQEEVDDKNLDTSKGEITTKGIIPSGQWHTEIPIDNPLQLRIKKHLRDNPSQHGHWNIIDHNTVQSPSYTDPNGVTREGYKKPITQILKSDPELLKDFSATKARATPTDSSASSYDPENNRRQRPKGAKERTWTAPISNDTHRIIISRHPYAIQGKSSKLKPWETCATYGCTTHAAGHLDHDVEQGGAVAYLVKSDETDPNNPHKAVGRIALQPFTSNSGHTVLRPSKRYGQDDQSESFFNTVKNHLETQQPLIDHEYTLNPHVYQADHSDKDKIITKELSPQEKLLHQKSLTQKIKNNTTTTDDIQHAIDNQYINHQHTAELAKNPTFHEYLAKTHYDGNNIGQDAINAIANNPKSTGAHNWLARAHSDGNNIGPDAINAIANNPKSTLAHNGLAWAHRGGTDIGTDAINAIANNPESTDAHELLAKAHKEGKYIDPDAINAIANNPESTDAHYELARAHSYGNNIGQDAINAIANNPESTLAHNWLAVAHRGETDIGPDAINAIANNPKSTSAHYGLAQAHSDGKDIGTDAINAIANNPESILAHGQLAIAHKEGKDIGDHAVQKLRSYGHNI